MNAASSDFNKNLTTRRENRSSAHTHIIHTLTARKLKTKRKKKVNKQKKSKSDM